MYDSPTKFHGTIMLEEFAYHFKLELFLLHRLPMLLVRHWVVLLDAQKE